MGERLREEAGLPPFSDHDLAELKAGADLAATSVHKLGGSMTQSSVLNVKSRVVDARHVQVILSMLTTTSTSYLLLASLDAARKELSGKLPGEVGR